MTSEAAADAGQPVVLHGQRGDVTAVFHAVAGAEAAVIWVGGTDGGVDGPADAIYPTLAADLATEGIASLRVALRVLGSPGNLAEALHDVQAGIAFLEGNSIRRVGLVGHSFGGAVVIAASVLSDKVAAVVTLSSQMGGTERVAEVSPRPLLLVHGQADDRLPPRSSQNIYDRAREPKRLVFLPDTRHSLRQRRPELRQLVRDWLVEKLNGQPTG
jgi:hypothetical protein